MTTRGIQTVGTRGDWVGWGWGGVSDGRAAEPSSVTSELRWFVPCSKLTKYIIIPLCFDVYKF